MAETKTRSRSGKQLSDEDAGKLLALMKRSDTVELKVTVPDSDLRSTVNHLGMDPLDAQMRQVFFFDTPDLQLSKAGVVVRARRVQGKGGDTVVKLRPVEPDDLPKDLRVSDSFGIEVDVMPGGHVCSASLKAKTGINDPREVALGARPIRKLFSKAQKAFYAEHAPAGIGLDDLTILGPILVFKLRSAPKDLNRRLVAEVWLYPDYSRVLELSTRCAPGEAFQVSAEARAFLTAKGIDLSGEQQTKTKKALQFFSKQFRSPKDRGPDTC